MKKIMNFFLKIKYFATGWKRGIDKNIIILNVLIWLFIEIVLCAYNRDIKDYVTKYFDMELLLAQFAAITLLWIVFIVAAYLEGKNGNSSNINKANTMTIEMAREEAAKVLIFFAAALLIGTVGKTAEIAIFSIKFNADNTLTRVALLYWPASWSIAMFLAAGLVNFKGK